MSAPVAVMHLVDTLAVGGAERMAVNIVNALPRDRFRPHLCCTRHSGPLAGALRDDVVLLALDRTRRFDAAALARLVAHVRLHDVRILHAHSSAVFVAALASLAPPFPAVVWHDHYGPPLDRRAAWPYRLIAPRLGGVISVNDALAAWARQRVGIAASRVRYVPNFVTPAPRAPGARPPAGLPGMASGRVACVANVRPQKDHATLIAAFARVVAAVPHARLLLMGAESDASYSAALRSAVDRAGLARHVSWLGVREDVADVLRECAVGVLSSVSEGLPLALLEYGMAGIPAVSTAVGQCAEVLDHGRAGLLVEPSDPAALAAALVRLLLDSAERERLGAALGARVEQGYGQSSAMAAVTGIYDSILGASASGRGRGWRAVRQGAAAGVRVTRNTPNAGRADGAGRALPPVGGEELTGVIGSDTVPPA